MERQTRTWRKQFVVCPMPAGKIFSRSIAFIVVLLPLLVLKSEKRQLQKMMKRFLDRVNLPKNTTFMWSREIMFNMRCTFSFKSWISWCSLVGTSSRFDLLTSRKMARDYSSTEGKTRFTYRPETYSTLWHRGQCFWIYPWSLSWHE